MTAVTTLLSQCLCTHQPAIPITVMNLCVHTSQPPPSTFSFLHKNSLTTQSHTLSHSYRPIEPRRRHWFRGLVKTSPLPIFFLLSCTIRWLMQHFQKIWQNVTQLAPTDNHQQCPAQVLLCSGPGGFPKMRQVSLSGHASTGSPGPQNQQ